MIAVAAFALIVVYLVVAFGWRTWMQIKRTGDSGFRGISGRPRSAEWWGGVLFVVALAAGVTAPVAAWMGLPSVSGLDTRPIQILGFVVALAGIIATLAAQVSMGESWRIGVDAGEETELVTTGAFAVVRNPIFSAMSVAAVGFTLVVANAVALIGLAVLIVAIEIQVRVVEEPYLARVHGTDWDAYMARVGRFVPRLGTVRGTRSPDVARDLH